MKITILLICLPISYVFGQLWLEPLHEIALIMQAGDFKTAEKYLNELTDEFPQDAALRLQIAQTYYAAKKPITAIQNCKWVLKQKNNYYVKASLLKWTIENDLSKHNKAIRTMRKAIEVEPENPHLYFNSALSHIQTGKEDKAQIFLLRTIEQDINYHQGHYYIAIEQIEKEAKKKAVESAIFYMYLSSDTDKCAQLLHHLNTLFDIPKEAYIRDSKAADKAIYEFYFKHYFSKRKIWNELPDFMIREMEKSEEYKLWMQNYILRLNRLGDAQHTATFLHCALAQANNQYSMNWIKNNESEVFDFFKWVEAGNL